MPLGRVGTAGDWGHPLLWRLKQRIDRAFMAGFLQPADMASAAPMACRGCAAKLPAQPLAAALERVGLGGSPKTPPSAEEKSCCSVDGFPALVSDPLNGRLTALHACSDLCLRRQCLQRHGNGHVADGLSQ